MNTINSECKKVGSSCYFGGRGQWLIAAAMHRDSDCLARSNFRTMQKRLEWAGNLVQIERFSHWAVGWVDYLLVQPDATALVREAEKMREALENYPVLDEEANQVWKDCYRPADRIKYIRAHKSQFEPQGFSDLLACVRGKYFIGYASELLN